VIPVCQITTARVDAAGFPAAGAGAAVSFLGIVRGEEDGAPIRGLLYEAYQPMAGRQLQAVGRELTARFPALLEARLVHRIGSIPVGEIALLVQTAAPHRADAFAACQFAVDRIKQLLPIWKQGEPAV